MSKNMNNKKELQLSDGAKCIIAVCAILFTCMFAMMISIVPLLSFAACLYVGWDISWYLINMLLSK